LVASASLRCTGFRSDRLVGRDSCQLSGKAGAGSVIHFGFLSLLKTPQACERSLMADGDRGF
jgi:hypothetical protein